MDKDDGYSNKLVEPPVHKRAKNIKPRKQSFFLVKAQVAAKEFVVAGKEKQLQALEAKCAWYKERIKNFDETNCQSDEGHNRQEPCGDLTMQSTQNSSNTTPLISNIENNV
ncbi:hypothetical protein QAD02_018669 [Eretmocerus hayati]|uniref:Uncharacterized protein n=1 Tax=Eretmocerus hayati TaxID=131215 RepID=A0ACC2PHC8_9HYME|nr:hypothetical protein QAD02_018669 [Eretmocerus hayati]